MDLKKCHFPLPWRKWVRAPQHTEFSGQPETLPTTEESKVPEYVWEQRQFLNLSMTDILGQTSLLQRAVLCIIQWSKTPGPLPTGCQQHPFSSNCDNQKSLQILPTVSWWGANSHPIENRCSNIMSSLRQPKISQKTQKNKKQFESSSLLV